MGLFFRCLNKLCEKDESEAKALLNATERLSLIGQLFQIMFES